MKKLVLLLSLFTLLSLSAFSDTLIKVALLTPIEIPQGANVTGLSLNALYGHTSSVVGVELGWFVNHTDSLVGIQGAGLANVAGNMEFGAQFGTVNVASGTGFQFGLINYSEQFRGIQVGTINYAGSLQGLQIGLANINFSGPVPIFPFFNFSFNF